MLDRTRQPLDTIETELVRAFRSNPNLVVHIRADREGRVVHVCLVGSLFEARDHPFLVTHGADTMNRLHKKCMIASGVTHGMLVVVLILGSAFTSSRKVEDDLPIMTFLDGRVVDQKLFGGGNPTIKPQPVASASPAAHAACACSPCSPTKRAGT